MKITPNWDELDYETDYALMVNDGEILAFFMAAPFDP